MEEIICLILCVLTLIVLKIVFKVSLKQAKKIEENKELQEITDKFSENTKIAKEMLKMLNNDSVIIEEEKGTKTSLYIAITNKILIAELKNNYGRIQTIAHECIHSVQDRRLLMFNFIFSNFTILYFVISVILMLCKVFTNGILQAFIIALFALIEFSVRGYLEIDAMTKSKFLAKDYIEKKQVITEEEKEQLLKEYDKINKMGIPFTLNYLISKSLIRIIIVLMTGVLI